MFRFYHRKPAAILLWVCVIGLLIVFKYDDAFRGELRFTCLAVSSGQAVVLETPGGENYLIDAGSMSYKNPGARVVSPFLRYRGIGKLDGIMLSHNDIDHINAVPETVLKVDTKAVYVNGAFLNSRDESKVTDRLFDYLEEERVPILNDREFEGGSEAEILITNAGDEIMNSPAASENDKSQIVIIRYAGRTILICGDITDSAQRAFLEKHPEFRADVLVVPHHGSMVNSMYDFHKRLGAKVLIASCGYRQYSGNIIKCEQAACYYTHRDGAIAVKIDRRGNMHINALK